MQYALHKARHTLLSTSIAMHPCLLSSNFPHASCLFSPFETDAFNKAGIDYDDPNIKVLTGAPANNGAACCDACADHNKQNGATTCIIGVWHNLGSASTCELKSSALRPVQGTYVRAYAPASPPKVFRFGNSQSSGMVLQAAPYRSNVWGICSKVNL